MWCAVVALSRIGLDKTQKTTLAKRRTRILGFSLEISSTHKNLNIFRSDSEVKTIKNAFSLSPIIALVKLQNLIEMSNMFQDKNGPVYKARLWWNIVEYPQARCFLATANDPVMGQVVDSSYSVDLSLICAFYYSPLQFVLNEIVLLWQNVWGLFWTII